MQSVNNQITLKKEIAEQHNVVRTNPKSYIPLLEQYLKYFKGNIMHKPGESIPIETNEGPDAVKECIDFLKAQKPLGALTFDLALCRSAQDHAEDIGKNGSCEHEGSDGSSADQRISRYCEWEETVAENLDFGSTNAQDVVISLIVDDGVAGRGHRMNIFNPSLKFIGVGIAKHTEYDVCTVLNYCGGIASYKNAEYKLTGQEVKETPKVSSADNQKKQNEKTPHNLSNLNKPVQTTSSIKNDPDAPSDAVSVSYRVVTRKRDGKIIQKKTTKTYLLADGKEEIVEIDEF